jgi:hypothetical protein
LGQQVPILDIYLLLEARRMKMNIASLESVDSYCEVGFFDKIFSLIILLINSLQNFKPKVLLIFLLLTILNLQYRIKIQMKK